jgi:hypothetical protein
MASNAPQQYNDYQYLLAYAFLIGILMLIARTRIGYVTIYYLLALMLFTMLLLAASSISKILAPIQR